MGKATGFLEYERVDQKAISPMVRIKNFNEFHESLPELEQRKQAGRCMDCGVPFCQAGMSIGGMAAGCPLNNLVPEWNDLLYYGNYEKAYERLHKTSPFPEFTSRVCPALCEHACTCGLNGEAVSTKANEKTIIENAYATGLAGAKPPKVRTGKKVAVIGSGPSGLACADYLNRRGHEVTVFERSDRVGGLLMYGIPNMKLEKQVIYRKVEVLKEEGIHFVTGANVGENVKATELLENYDRIVLACGASNPRDVKVPGRDAKGIYYAVDFLRSTTKALWDAKEASLKEQGISLEGACKKDGALNQDLWSMDLSQVKSGSFISAKGKRVVIIGGGDTGNDCMGTCMRHGCKSVVQLEMNPEPPKARLASNPWPEWPRVLKTDYGQEEAMARFDGDPRIYQTTVKEFVKDGRGNVKKIILVQTAPKTDPATGRRMMVPVEGTEKEMACDMVLIAAGFLGAQSYVTDAFGVELNPRTTVATTYGHYETNVKNIFTAGDMHRGQSLVVWAVREGRDCAKAVDESLMGYTGLV